MLDLEEEVIDHALGQGFAMIDFQSQKNEVTVPAIHLVEASPGHNIG